MIAVSSEIFSPHVILFCYTIIRDINGSVYSVFSSKIGGLSIKLNRLWGLTPPIALLTANAKGILSLCTRAYPTVDSWNYLKLFSLGIELVIPLVIYTGFLSAILQVIYTGLLPVIAKVYYVTLTWVYQSLQFRLTNFIQYLAKSNGWYLRLS